MPRNGSGTYTLPAGNPVVTGTVISSTVQNNTMSDVATALTNSIAKDGQTTPTANLPMGGFKLTGMGTGNSNTDSLTLGQAQNEAYQWLSSVSGGDTITASTSPVTTSYGAGQTYRFVAAATNTTNVTLNINSLGAKAVTKRGATALAAGDLLISTVYEVTYDGAQFQVNALSTPTAPFTDTAAIVKGSSDATKLLAFEVDTNQSTGTTRTVTTQNLSGTMELVESQIKPITASVASNALTITLNPCALAFRSSTLSSGTVNVRAVNSAISMTVSSGSTLGTVSAQAARLVILAIDNAGTVELAIVNISGGNQLDEANLISTTAEGGAGAADSANVIYSTTARSNVPYRVVGFIDITEATAGTWATAPSTIQGVGGQALTSLSSIGYGQTWQDVSASRALSTTYYNTTGKPIFISVSAISSGGSSMAINVNGASASIGTVSTAAGRSGTTAIIPPGANYSGTISGGSSILWYELR